MNYLTRAAKIRAELTCPRIARENMVIAVVCGIILGAMFGFSV